MALFHITIEKVIVESDADLKKLLQSVISKLETMATTLDQVLQSVTENSAVDDSIIALLQGIKTQLDEVLSGTVVPPAVQEKIDAIFAISEADKQKVADAVTANTPADPGTPTT